MEIQSFLGISTALAVPAMVMTITLWAVPGLMHTLDKISLQIKNNNE